MSEDRKLTNKLTISNKVKLSKILINTKYDTFAKSRMYTVHNILCYLYSQLVYGATLTSDPEGILGTFSSAFMCFLGLQVNNVLIRID